MSVPDLDPEIIAVLRKAEEAGTPGIETLTPEENRANYARVAKEQFGPVDEGGVLGHAIGAAQVAAVRHADAKVVVPPAEGVDQRACRCQRESSHHVPG